jgi:hypothetical protein
MSNSIRQRQETLDQSRIATNTKVAVVDPGTAWNKAAE